MRASPTSSRPICRTQLDDLKGSAGVLRLKEELLRRVNVGGRAL